MDYPSGPKVITRVLEHKREHGRRNQRDGTISLTLIASKMKEDGDKPSKLDSL